MTCIVQLDNVIGSLRNAFIDRPVPTGEPSDDLTRPLELLDRFGDVLRLIGPETAIDDEQLLDSLQTAIGIYHDLWRNPFPQGFEQGQILLGAVMEKPLRALLRHLEGAREREPTAEDFHDEVVLEANEEIERLNDWLDALPTGSLHRVPAKPLGFESLAASFLLGWWIGVE